MHVCRPTWQKSLAGLETETSAGPHVLGITGLPLAVPLVNAAEPQTAPSLQRGVWTIHLIL